MLCYACLCILSRSGSMYKGYITINFVYNFSGFLCVSKSPSSFYR